MIFNYRQLPVRLPHENGASRDTLVMQPVQMTSIWVCYYGGLCPTIEDGTITLLESDEQRRYTLSQLIYTASSWSIRNKSYIRFLF